MKLDIELAHIERKGYRWYQSNMGESVIWFEFDGHGSTYHHVYDEGGKKYLPGMLVPVLWANEMEPDEENSPEGRRFVQTLRFAVSVQSLRRIGLSAVMDSSRHLNDIVLYGQNYFAIGDYKVRGRLRESLIVGVRATRIHVDDSMEFSEVPGPFGEPFATRGLKGNLGHPNDGFPNMSFPDHEPPAHQGVLAEPIPAEVDTDAFPPSAP